MVMIFMCNESLKKKKKKMKRKTLSKYPALQFNSIQMVKIYGCWTDDEFNFHCTYLGTHSISSYHVDRFFFGCWLFKKENFWHKRNLYRSPIEKRKTEFWCQHFRCTLLLLLCHYNWYAICDTSVFPSSYKFSSVWIMWVQLFLSISKEHNEFKNV